MTKICYKEKNFSDGSLNIIKQANRIIKEYMADGMSLTLRQLYYQFVSRDWLSNEQKEYKRLGSIISDARMAGLIDWEAIEDRTRNLRGNSHWTDPGHIMESVVRSYRLDHWEGQFWRPEVWIEKEALIGVIAGICEDLDVGYFACKGYVSKSEMWRAARRHVRKFAEYNQRPVIIHLGDHDPSGLDMTRDIDEQLEVFVREDSLDANVYVERIALNMDQIEEYDPPPNPAKFTDSRAKGYVAEHGTSSWELDALEPRILRDLIEKTVLRYRNESTYQDVLKQEEEQRVILRNVQENWEDMV